MAEHCFYRANPTNDVREWSAKSDVQSVGNAGVWNPTVTSGGYTGAIVIPDSDLPSPSSPQYPQAGQFITATQIGDPPMWADRWSTVGNQSGSSNYKIGDLISFKGLATTGSFTQQVAIAVDQVADATGNTLVASGEIWKWHFVWGGQYTVPPDATMMVDPAHSQIASGDTSATFIPAWSGWSAMDQGTTLDGGGTGVTLGEVITFGVAGGTVNQGHHPKIVVMAESGGVLQAWEWLDYGSYSAIPSMATPLVQQSPACTTGCVSLNPEWTRGALATTIAHVTHDANCVSEFTCIFPTDVPPGVQMNQPIEGFYYGDDDGAAINTALQDSPNASPVRVSGFCGTTVPIALPNNNAGSTTPANAALVGDAYKSGGLFAFAYDLADRTAHPLMNHLVYSGGSKLPFGGGVRDLEIKGGGVPQGYGYYLLYHGATAPPGYDGPTSCTPSPCQESTGSVVEIDQAKEAFFTDLAIYDAYGEGNANFQSGVADADPEGYIPSDFGSIFVSSIRAAVTNNQFGALDPEYGINFDGAHDSQFSNLIAFDGTQADIEERKGNIYSGIHVESDALNGAHGTAAPSMIDWTGIGPLAGVALYGVESPKNVILNDMQCDTVWSACVYLGAAGALHSDTPTVVSNVAQKCSGFQNVWPTYYGVELAAGTSGAAISNVTGRPSCGIANTQLVHYDGAIDPSVQAVSQSPAAQFCSPSLGFQPGRFYTTPFTSASSFTVAANTLYAIPVQIPCTVTVSQLSTYVITGVPIKSCEYGIYGNNGQGQPGALILDAGNTLVSPPGGNKAISGLSQPLAPGLIFLVVGCNASPTLNAGATTGTLLGSLVGLTAQTDTSAVEESTAWTFGALPPEFPAVTYAATAPPLVYLTP
ncbi:MAG TPA: hypothetical protein VHX61_03335 [Rhizomicrobium sp.]|nr:hypothetical protein [Rhizomicrobium sp.]